MSSAAADGDDGVPEGRDFLVKPRGLFLEHRAEGRVIAAQGHIFSPVAETRVWTWTLRLLMFCMEYALLKLALNVAALCSVFFTVNSHG